jgi:hypothetical protein
MKNYPALFFVFLLISLPLKSKVVELEGVIKPDMILAGNNKLYVMEKTSIFIYSLKDFKLIKKFGREGEGPGEFLARPFGPPMSMSFVNGELVVNSNNKLSYFDEMGNFKRERKALANLVLFQLKDRFVAVGPTPDPNSKFRISYRLLSDDFKELKNLYHTDISVNPQDDVILPLSAIGHNPCYRDMVVISASDTDFVIDIFDTEGNKIRRITKDFEKVKIPEKFKQDVHNWFKNESMFKEFYKSIKGFIKFKDYFPAIRDIHLADDTIHVVTHKRKNGLWEFILLDLKGNEKKRIYIPLDRYIPFTYYPLLYTEKNGTLYSLTEDEDQETWRLQVIKMY